ncbi:MAG: MBL fold metallo-hydrolase [Balneolaceae bacterium]
MSEDTPPSATVGPFELFSIDAGSFRLDGGAMFGVVPKTLWSRVIGSDEKNRIPMTMRCLLIKSSRTGKIYLADTGSGTKFNEKMTSIYALDYSNGDLLRSLAACGVTPGEVTDIIFTHLHFDHCGGATRYDENGELQDQFPNAAYHVTEKQLEAALDPNEREKASFIKDNVDPIAGSDRLHEISDRHVYEEGLATIPSYGHTMGQQLPVIEADGKTVVFAADLIPTHVHLPMPWIMGYDMMPLQTLKEKEAFLREAVDNGWYLFLEHDAEHELITVKEEDGKYVMDKSLTLEDL